MTILKSIHELEKMTTRELRALKAIYVRLLIASETWSYERAQILATLENIDRTIAKHSVIAPWIARF